MIHVIETNLYLDNDGNIGSFQSRVIEVESWESLIQEVKEKKMVNRRCCLNGNLMGVTVSQFSDVSNIVYDDKSLMCDITTYTKRKIKKLLYRSGG